MMAVLAAVVSSAALVVGTPAAVAGKFRATITQVDGYSDGLSTHLGSPACAFHAKITYSTTGHVPKVLNSSMYLAKGTPPSQISQGFSPAGWEPLGSSPFTTSATYYPADGGLLSTAASDYRFFVAIYVRHRFHTSATTGAFTLDPLNYVSGCPAASTTPLVTTTGF